MPNYPRSPDVFAFMPPSWPAAALFALGALLASKSVQADVNASTAETESTSSASSLHHGSVFVDPLGFLLFGPTAGVELGSDKLSGTVYGRWLNPGVLGHSLFLNNDERFGFSYGAGLRGRYFFNGRLAGPHLGVGTELIHTRVEDPSNLLATNSLYVVPALDGGYRLPFGSAYVGIAGAFGYAFRASSSVENLPGGKFAEFSHARDNSTVYGSASLELGVYF